jgi:hypothetical protein
MFPKSQRGKVLGKYSENVKKRIKWFIRAKLPTEELKKRFKLSDFDAAVFIAEYSAQIISLPSNKTQGYKKEPYYKEEFPAKPVYKLEDLVAEEKMISKKDTTTKLWTWEE